MENFSPFSALAGGLLIGLATTLLLGGIGRIAGISGILASAMSGIDTTWRRLFLIAMVSTGAIMSLLTPSVFVTPTRSSPLVLVIAGLLVGLGTRIGSGCASGHGVCGLPRLSIRSLFAVGTFMLTGAITVFAMRTWGAFDA